MVLSLFSRFADFSKRHFDDLSEQEILALAISSEEDDGRIYEAYADMLREEFPDSAKIFTEMAEEEDEHRRWLIDMHKEKFGEKIPLIRREHVRGFYARKPIWLAKGTLATIGGIEAIRKQAADMETQAARFYSAAMKRSKDASIRKLLGDLARAEAGHIGAAMSAEKKHTPQDVREDEEAA